MSSDVLDDLIKAYRWGLEYADCIPFAGEYAPPQWVSWVWH